MLANAAMSVGDSGPAAQGLTCAKSLFSDLDETVMGLGLVLGEFQAQLSWTPELLCVTPVDPGPALKDPGRDGFSESWGRRMQKVRKEEEKWEC